LRSGNAEQAIQWTRLVQRVQTRNTYDEVLIDQMRQYVAGAPRYALELAAVRFLTNVYDYYGYAPYWGTPSKP